MTDYSTLFEKALALEDDVTRAHAIEDLCYDAECLLASGQKKSAIEIFRQIYSLGRDDDLVATAYDTARKALISEGVVTLPEFSDVLKSLNEKFSELPPRDRMLAVAKTIHREYLDDYPNGISKALELTATANQLAALNKKERKFQLQLQIISQNP